jgi:aminopeptidase-like protein
MQMAMLWVLNLSDGNHSILDISERSGIDLMLIRQVADILESHELLKPAKG